jgi:hypothetical protein
MRREYHLQVQVPELIKYGIDPDLRELGLGDLQVEVPDVGEVLIWEMHASLDVDGAAS